MANFSVVGDAGCVVEELLSMGERRLRAGSLQCGHIAATLHSQGYLSRPQERHAILDPVQSEVVMCCDGRIVRTPWRLFQEAHQSWRAVRVPVTADDARAVLRRAESMVGSAAEAPDSEGSTFVDSCFADIESLEATDGHRAQLYRLASPDWWAFEERKARAPLKTAPCMHIAAPLPADTLANTLREHHAVLDVCSQEVIHYAEQPFAVFSSDCPANAGAVPSAGNHAAGSAPCKVRVEPFEDFWRAFPSWRVVQLPESQEHAREVLRRARSNVGESEYVATSTDCEHFASWCFSGEEASGNVVSTTAATTAASSAVSCGMSYSIASSVTYTVATPYYALGLIPWGTTTTTVGLSSYAIAGIASLGLGIGLAASAAAVVGLNMMARSSNELLSLRVPICVGNKTDDEELAVTIRNLDSMFSPVLGRMSSTKLDDVAHWARSRRGVGTTEQTVPPLALVEFSPPAYEECYERFELCFMARRCTPLGPSTASTPAPCPVAPVAAAPTPSAPAPPVALANMEGETCGGGSDKTDAAFGGNVGAVAGTCEGNAGEELGGSGAAVAGQPGSGADLVSHSWRDYLPSMPPILSSRNSQTPPDASQSAPPATASLTPSAPPAVQEDHQQWREVCRREARRGAVLIFMGGNDVLEIS